MYSILNSLGTFVKLLLTTSQDQVKAIFNTLTPLQSAVISEIIYNIGTLPVTSRVVKLLRKHKLLFRKLSDKTVPTHRKVFLIQKHYKEVQNLLSLLKSDILNILE